uniref:Uncharacterized protein ycf35 n=1 Tax=Gracilaria caudata TaxID=2572395 RepID=A0A345U6D3_9FLOR|nr:hypothetical protein [Gracilaria caudata]YP_010196061.1 hypothetical protein LK014_pgp202 [Gracilaria caudata]AXI96019.1 hypothetical protein [Gracilaria caudata]UAD83458.1 hypothetical protein [Gracilaria caudata]
MSHFSRIKTSITNLNILKKTLKDLNFEYSMEKQSLEDSNGNSEYIDMIIQKNDKNIMGFLWNGKEYTFIADFDLWQHNYDIYPENIIEKILQQYAINSITEVSHNEGFTTVNKQKLLDGSVKLIVQRWN